MFIPVTKSLTPSPYEVVLLMEGPNESSLLVILDLFLRVSKHISHYYLISFVMSFLFPSLAARKSRIARSQKIKRPNSQRKFAKIY
jgi:hypothetical protein